MKFFKSKWSPDDKPIEGQHPHCLPMITCPHCKNHRAATSATYPWVDLKKVIDPTTEKRLRWGKTRSRGDAGADFTWEEFQKLKTRIREFLDPNLPLAPCATFGSFTGKLYVRPKLTDFVLTVTDDALLVRRDVVQKLNELGNNLRFFEISLTLPKNERADYVEIWAPPIGKSGTSSGNRYCSYCERGSGREKFIIDQPEIGSKDNVFVLKDALSPMIFSEKLVEDIQANGFSGLEFELTPCE